MCKAPTEEGGARMEQGNAKMNKLDEIHANSCEIGTKFVRIWYEFHVNFVQFGNEGRNHTSKHTLQSHGHVINYARAFEHLGSRNAAAVLSRCHSVVGRIGGETPDMAKWISNSPLTLSPLQISIWCTFPTKKRTP